MAKKLITIDRICSMMVMELYKRGLHLDVWVKVIRNEYIHCMYNNRTISYFMIENGVIDSVDAEDPNTKTFIFKDPKMASNIIDDVLGKFQLK